MTTPDKIPAEIPDEDLIEIEASDENLDDEPENPDLKSPFDPKEIRIIVEPKTIDHLVTRLRHDEIDLYTEFQRKGNLWKPDAQSRLIESILLRFPLPGFYFDVDNDEKWLIVDGLQRIWTLKNFVVDESLELNGLEILKTYSGKGITYSKLNRTMQRRILEAPITTYLIQPGTPKKVKYNVFRRINTGGLGLNPMEIRNALNQGKPSKFLKDTSESTRFTEQIKVANKRMEDRELLLRAIAFINNNYREYEKPLAEFLDKTMEGLEKINSTALKKLTESILRAIEFQNQLFGKHMFSRSIMGGDLRVRLNSALFEVWVSLTSKLNESEMNKLLANRDTLIKSYTALLKNEDFHRAISTSTSGKGSVKRRFEEIAELIKKYKK